MLKNSHSTFATRSRIKIFDRQKLHLITWPKHTMILCLLSVIYCFIIFGVTIVVGHLSFRREQWSDIRHIFADQKSWSQSQMHNRRHISHSPVACRSICTQDENGIKQCLQDLACLIFNGSVKGQIATAYPWFVDCHAQFIGYLDPLISSQKGLISILILVLNASTLDIAILTTRPWCPDMWNSCSYELQTIVCWPPVKCPFSS